MTTTVRSIRVDALQSVKLFGLWDQPRELVSWEDVRKKGLSWRILRSNFNFSTEELYKLQPDKKKWISFGRLTLHDLPEMKCFPINPIQDMCADLGEIWSMRWQATDLAEMNVTFLQLQRSGMTPEIMKHFNFPLSEWLMLGLDVQYVKPEFEYVFGMPVDEVRELISDFKARQSEID